MKYFLLSIFPKKLFSFYFGKLMGITLPKPLARWLVSFYIRIFSVDMADVKGGVGDYSSLGAFFVRELKPGSRELAVGVVSPVDGRVLDFGRVDASGLYRLKGYDYSLSDLLVDDELLGTFLGGSFISIYLSPSDYHHIHSPVDARIEAFWHVSGNLWPVNAWSVDNVEGLYSQNERVSTLLDSAFGPLCVVKVGALNVGSISLAYEDYVTNAKPRLFEGHPILTRAPVAGRRDLKKGQKMATFCMGSTVLLLSSNSRLAFDKSLEMGKKLLYGAPIWA